MEPPLNTDRMPRPIGDMLPAAFNSGFVEAGGLRLHYLDYGTEGCTPMLCVHGGGAHAHWFDFVAPGFVTDYHVRALDLRGHGDSSWAAPSSYSNERFAKDLAEVAEQLDLRDFVLIGHSMGGMISLLYAATGAQRLGKLVIVDSTMRLSEGRIAALHDIGNRGGRSYGTREEFIARYRLLPEGTTAASEIVRYVAHHAGRQQPDGRWRHKFDRHVYATRKAIDGLAEFEHVGVPTLLVKGALSGRITPEIVAQVKARCAHVKVAEVSNSDHNVTLDNPSGFVKVVQTFLDNHS